MTRRVALIGEPLRRRHSEVMHNAAFTAFDIDARFELRPLPRADLPAFVAAARDPAWLGFGVTAPYKREVMPLLDEVEPDARAVGAVNNIVREDDGRLVGFNTDTVGFASAVRSELALELRGARVVVTGAGGAAYAVAHACIAAGAADLVVVNRTPAAAQELVTRVVSPTTTVRAAAPTDPDLTGTLASADLLVNATTVGMTSPGVTVAPEALSDAAAVFDLVYVPVETELLRRARARGLAACNGSAMLVAQGVAAFARWTGVTDSGEVMRRALEPLLRADAPA